MTSSRKQVITSSSVHREIQASVSEISWELGVCSEEPPREDVLTQVLPLELEGPRIIPGVDSGQLSVCEHPSWLWWPSRYLWQLLLLTQAPRKSKLISVRHRQACLPSHPMPATFLHGHHLNCFSPLKISLAFFFSIRHCKGIHSER